MSIPTREQQIGVTIPSTAVKMFVVQPYLQLQNPLQEPFPLRPDCSRRLLDAITNVFEMSRAYRPHLVLFPEFALPGVDAVERVIASLSAETVSSPTIVIGGVSGLSKGEYARLCRLNLPMPARYLVDKAGVIRAADVNADYTIRTEPSETLRQLRALSAAVPD